ncbi:hypothetical protein NDI56_07185 [Haloarcula sp. S1CR25-12]|uniref:Flagellin n=1 Tax=Haloarcula saliterrae TaxID=2950534 RepID=A0ABU2FAA3_9EURY|nr:hypothetical protein [Haloarcula sp. S1CR25-12]MDS0259174.1 hypothetical protein [Haloarcula sp. S1CR25-12]
MADLRRDDRGQIILVAAFALAVIFVVMALIVNSAIFTENLASRGETTGSNGALSMRAMVEANVGDSVAAANRNDNATAAALATAVQAGVRNISEQTGRQSARSGRVVDVAYQSSTPGVRVYQSNNSTFTDDAGDESYQVAGLVSRADGANGTRAFEIEANSITATDNGSAFEIRAQSTPATGVQESWRARIWESGGDTVHVRTLRDVGSTTAVEDCTVTHDGPGASVDIDVTGGTIDGEECDALGTAPTGRNFHFGAGTGVTPGTTESYNISFANADAISGNFSMVLYRRSPLSPEVSPLRTAPASSPALYDVTVRYTYLTTDMRYETDVRVAPGEADV